jgi:hypothetical protein
MTEKRLLAVLAHPDDEAYRLGGTLALLARRPRSPAHGLARTGRFVRRTAVVSPRRITHRHADCHSARP